MTGDSNENWTAAALVPFAAAPDQVWPRVVVHHDSSFVAQLIAGAKDLPDVPKRRRLERAEAFAAYHTTETAAQPKRTRRIV